jgi:hypothetical protein
MYTIFHERQNRARAYYEKHFAWKVLSCLYCKTRIPFGPYGKDLVHVADCPSCATAYEIALEEHATPYGIEVVSYRPGSGREPRPVPEDRSMPIINPGITLDTFADDRTQASTTFFYPLDLFMQYVNEGVEGVDVRKCARWLEFWSCAQIAWGNEGTSSAKAIRRYPIRNRYSANFGGHLLYGYSSVP